MGCATQHDQRLAAAYRATAYLVAAAEGRESFVIRCEERSAATDRLLQRHGLHDWAFITACDPRSRVLTPAENATRMARLVAAVDDLGHPYLAGSGEGADGQWPAEPSLLVLGIPEADAIRLATAFDQHAILAGRRGEPARLVWTPAAEAIESGRGTGPIRKY